MTVGTPEHRDLFCRWFIDTHVTFEPEALPWPALDTVYLERLRAFPFWGYARSIEQRAGRMVTAYAQTIDDPLIREAIAVQGVEETRHGRLMSHVLERYQIDAALLAIEDAPATREDFCVFGFGECTDSFIGFGAFAMVRKRGLFPDALLDIFENVLFEEARHITFFTNWYRYEERRAGRDKPVLRTLDALGYHVRAIMGTAAGAAETPLPKLEGDIVEGIAPADFLATALAENRRHMAKIPRALLRPRLMPTLATAALLGIRMLPPRKPALAAVPDQASRTRDAA
jgi:hypothetical protein